MDCSGPLEEIRLKKGRVELQNGPELAVFAESSLVTVRLVCDDLAEERGRVPDAEVAIRLEIQATVLVCSACVTFDLVDIDATAPIN